MTYALALLGAALLATGTRPRLGAAVGGCVAAGIMLDPQGRRRRRRPAVLARPHRHLGADHAGVADPGPRPPELGGPGDRVAGARLGGGGGRAGDLRRDRPAGARVCVPRPARGVDRRGWRPVERRYEIALAVGAIAGAVARACGAAPHRGPRRVLLDRPLGHASWRSVSRILGHNLPVVGHGLLLLFGADFLDYPGSARPRRAAPGRRAAVVVAASRWRAGASADRDLVAQLLLAGIVINLAAFVASTTRLRAPTPRARSPRCSRSPPRWPDASSAAAAAVRRPPPGLCCARSAWCWPGTWPALASSSPRRPRRRRTRS